ncbi:hypothetical protein C475_07986 [Halosimplex carlsbadense 2-9-1]|uniref:Uncharacterized protein n=1 Tax=Halosimplex carlsbadense 2-9-1 TaxID=797114 RepID=M0CW31_9EURY|nr:hypothetical protein [Halosimplex carlsbadense]ELZ26858.1 hypothetical protein C475_07986 [Halosimplex carlsbadense 2-9-1]
MTRSDRETAADTSTSSPISTAVALALAASLAWAGVAAAGFAGPGEPPADGADSDAASPTPRVPNESETPRANGTDAVALDVQEIRNCGDRCRRVTANVTNNGTETLRNVTAQTRIYASDSRIWGRNYSFGNLSANASAERTARIELSLPELLRVARNDGRVRIKTTVRWDGGNATFTERRRVLD